MDKKIFRNSFVLGKRIVTIEAWRTMTCKTTAQEESKNNDLTQERN